MLSPPRNSEQVLNIPLFINQAHLETTHPQHGGSLKGGGGALHSVRLNLWSLTKNKQLGHTYDDRGEADTTLLIVLLKSRNEIYLVYSDTICYIWNKRKKAERIFKASAIRSQYFVSLPFDFRWSRPSVQWTKMTPSKDITSTIGWSQRC